MSGTAADRVDAEEDGPVVDDDRGIAAWVLGDLGLAAACSAAVEPLEIAARLETHGVSSQVAADTFGLADVFDAAFRRTANPGLVHTYEPKPEPAVPQVAVEPRKRPVGLARLFPSW